MKTIEINGKTFIINKLKKPYKEIYLPTKDLYSLYKKPSQYKQAIYNDWLRWFSETDTVSNMTVLSGNCSFFTIGGYYDDPINGLHGIIKITYANNYLYI